jgi:hypothetical protein
MINLNPARYTRVRWPHMPGKMSAIDRTAASAGSRPRVQADSTQTSVLKAADDNIRSRQPGPQGEPWP